MVIQIAKNSINVRSGTARFAVAVQSSTIRQALSRRLRRLSWIACEAFAYIGDSATCGYEVRGLELDGWWFGETGGAIDVRDDPPVPDGCRLDGRPDAQGRHAIRRPRPRGGRRRPLYGDRHRRRDGDDGHAVRGRGGGPTLRGRGGASTREPGRVPGRGD